MKFGDTFFLQKIGTAMGTSCAVIFANLYYAWHEKPSSYQSICIGNEEEFEHYIQDLNTFGILK
ncbi:hypothetical protein ACHAW6_003955 [Cyclotella cf. meneghiniana]